MEKLRMAVIGVGRRANAHLPVIAVMKDIFELVGVCDIDAERAREVAERYKTAWFSSVYDLFEKAKPDVVDIIVPADGHHAVAKAAAEAKVHMLVETPIAITLPCADLMIQAAQEAGVKLEVAENVWRFPQQRMHKVIADSGVIGDVVRTYCVYTTGGYHAMNIIRVLAGAEAVEAMGKTGYWEIPLVTDHAGRRITSESWIMGIITFENGVIGIHEGSNTYSSVLRRNAPRFYRVDGAKGFAVNDDLFLAEEGEVKRYQMRYLTADSAPDRIVVDTDPPLEWENPFKRYSLSWGHLAVASELYSIYRAVVEDEEPEYGAIQARKDQELSIAIRESARKGSPVELPLTEMTEVERGIHESFARRYGCDPLEVEKLILKPYPRV